MTLTNTERQALSRYRKAHNLVQIIAWVPSDKAQAVKDAIDTITGEADK